MITDSNRLYRMVKWVWLLLQALILPLAAVHAVAVPAGYWPLIIPLPLLVFFGTAFLVLWLIAQSLLAMARFPLTLGGSLLLVGGTVAQFAFLAVSGGSLAGAAYSVFFATLAALALVALILTAVALRRRTGPLPARLLALLAQLPVAGLVWFMLAPLRPVFSGLGPRREWLEWLVLGSNVGLIVFNLSRFSIFAPQAPDEEAYDREWERWAAPTIIILILSATAAAVVTGVG
ncbi:MAG: hypothetical protein NTW95_02175 [Candidatus Aminicenantes bacterium]|nr:hypothetical protein [Candidatus Aminicenantes bacterium]